MDLLTSKLPGGKLVPFTMDDRELIRAFLLEDEEHKAWAAKSPLLLKIVNDLDDLDSTPSQEQWQFLLTAAAEDYVMTRIREIGEMVLEILEKFGNPTVLPDLEHGRNIQQRETVLNTERYAVLDRLSRNISWEELD